MVFFLFEKNKLESITYDHLSRSTRSLVQHTHAYRMPTKSSSRNSKNVCLEAGVSNRPTDRPTEAHKSSPNIVRPERKNPMPLRHSTQHTHTLTCTHGEKSPVL